MMELDAWEGSSFIFLFVIKSAAGFKKLEAFNANL